METGEDREGGGEYQSIGLCMFKAIAKLWVKKYHTLTVTRGLRQSPEPGYHIEHGWPVECCV